MVNQFQSVTHGEILIYQVYYSGITVNVTTSITTLTFTAPSLPDGVFSGTVVVMVTAVSSIGVGPASDPATTDIRGTYLLHLRMLTYIYMHIIIFVYKMSHIILSVFDKVSFPCTYI